MQKAGGGLLKKSGNLFFSEKSRFFAFPTNLREAKGLRPFLFFKDLMESTLKKPAPDVKIPGTT